jgi:putative glutamine amidotransferase
VSRPRIGVTWRDVPGGATGTPVPDLYLDAVRRAGGEPVTLHASVLRAADVGSVVATLDALVLSGGQDVDPQWYGEPPSPKNSPYDVEADRVEVAALGEAVARHLPVLAICRGLQLVNVAAGGTLYQHFCDTLEIAPHGAPMTPNGARIHDITVDPGSALHRMLGVGAVSSSCHHHQAVRDVAAGYRVVARAADGIVEAIERPEDNIVAVQWHPEDTAATDAVQQRLFDAFVSRATGAPR